MGGGTWLLLLSLNSINSVRVFLFSGHSGRQNPFFFHLFIYFEIRSEHWLINWLIFLFCYIIYFGTGGGNWLERAREGVWVLVFGWPDRWRGARPPNKQRNHLPFFFVCLCVCYRCWWLRVMGVMLMCGNVATSPRCRPMILFLSLSLSLRLPLSLYQNRHTCLHVCVFLYLFVYYSPKSERKRGGETERDSIISPSVPGGISSYCYYNTITFSDIMVMRAYNSCLRWLLLRNGFGWKGGRGEGRRFSYWFFIL